MAELWPLRWPRNAWLTGGSWISILLSHKFHMTWPFWERSGSMVACLTGDRGAAGSSLKGITVLCPWARHINPSLVLVQPRKTRPCLTERLLMGRKGNQTNKHTEKKQLDIGRTLTLLMTSQCRAYRGDAGFPFPCPINFIWSVHCDFVFRKLRTVIMKTITVLNVRDQLLEHHQLKINSFRYCHSPPSADLFKKGCCQLQAKVCAQITG